MESSIRMLDTFRVGPAEYEQFTGFPCGGLVVLWKCWFGVGVWGVGTLLGFEETTAWPALRGWVGWCFLGAARHRVIRLDCLVVVLVCCLRIV